MSACGYKQTFGTYPANVCFTPKSGHSGPILKMSAFDPKRTFAGLGLWAGGDRKTVVSAPKFCPLDGRNLMELPLCRDALQPTLFGRLGRDHPVRWEADGDRRSLSGTALDIQCATMNFDEPF